MDVNYMGPVRMIKALLPALRQNSKYNRALPRDKRDIDPRIANITSFLGRTTVPFYGAYSASKHALEAMCDTLRVELLPWKIHVTMVEPGVTRTRIIHPDFLEIEKKHWSPPGSGSGSPTSAPASPITPNVLQRRLSDAVGTLNVNATGGGATFHDRNTQLTTESAVTDETRSLYGDEFMPRALDFWQKVHASQESPRVVVHQVVDAVEAAYPRDRYIVGTATNVYILATQFLPAWVLDLAWGSMVRLIGAWPKEARALED